MTFSSFDTISRTNIDPYFLPAADPLYEDIGELSLGDTHGGMLPIFRTGQIKGIFKFTTALYAKIASLMSNPSILKGDDYAFYYDTLLNVINPEKNGELIRLLGDECGDRNGCDLFLLLFLKALKQKNIHYTILLSNHNYELIYNYEQNENFIGYIMKEDLIASLIALQDVIDENLIAEIQDGQEIKNSRTVVNELIKEYYLPHLELIDYSVDKHGQLTIFSHAPTGPRHISNIAQDLGIPNYLEFLTGDVNTCIAILEAIRQKFRGYRDNNTIHTLVKFKKGNGEQKGLSIGKLIWGRKFDSELNPKIRFVNGHEHGIIPPSNRILLNTNFCKFPEEDNKFPKEDYQWMFTHDSKAYNCWFFRKPYEILKQKVIPEILSPKDLKSLLNEDKIYSTYQIRGLMLLLCTPQRSQALWAGFKSSHTAYKISNNVYLRNIIYVLLELNLDDFIINSIILIKEKPDRHYIFIYEALLFLRNYPFTNLIPLILSLFQLSTQAIENIYAESDVYGFYWYALLTKKGIPEAKMEDYLVLCSQLAEFKSIKLIDFLHHDHPINEHIELFKYLASIEWIDTEVADQILELLEKSTPIIEIQLQIIQERNSIIALIPLKIFNESWNKKILEFSKNKNMDLLESTLNKQCIEILYRWCVDSIENSYDDAYKSYYYNFYNTLRRLYAQVIGICQDANFYKNKVTVLDNLLYISTMDNYSPMHPLIILDILTKEEFMLKCIAIWEIGEHISQRELFFNSVFGYHDPNIDYHSIINFIFWFYSSPQNIFKKSISLGYHLAFKLNAIQKENLLNFLKTLDLNQLKTILRALFNIVSELEGLKILQSHLDEIKDENELLTALLAAGTVKLKIVSPFFKPVLNDSEDIEENKESLSNRLTKA